MFLENPFVPGVRVNVGRALPVQSFSCYPVALVSETFRTRKDVEPWLHTSPSFIWLNKCNRPSAPREPVPDAAPSELPAVPIPRS